VWFIPNLKTWKNKNNKILFAYSPRTKLISTLHINPKGKSFKNEKYICSKNKIIKVTKNK
jgi:hypothetical protein